MIRWDENPQSSAILCFILIIFSTGLYFVNDALSIGQVSRADIGSYHLGPMVGEPRTLHLSSDKYKIVTIGMKSTDEFNLSTSSGEANWKKSYPQGGGSIRLSEKSSWQSDRNRAVFVSMYHQLHCVETFGKELINPSKITDQSARGHIQHCLNFLREIALCRPDLTLEPGDFTKWDFTTDVQPWKNMLSDSKGDDIRETAVQEPSPRVCRDWGAIYDKLSDNYSRWKETKRKMEALD